jgi:hypothetical protein
MILQKVRNSDPITKLALRFETNGKDVIYFNEFRQNQGNNSIDANIDYDYTRKHMDTMAAKSAVAASENLSILELQQAIDEYKAAKGKLTKREGGTSATPRAKRGARNLSQPQVAAIIDSSQLGRLTRRYEDRLARIELPPEGEGFQTKQQAQEAGKLWSTYQSLRTLEGQLGLPPTAEDSRVTEAQRLRTAFYRNSKTPAPARKGRGIPPRAASM